MLRTRFVRTDSSINLLVASLDLKLVKLLRDAIRTADITGAEQKAMAGATSRIEQRRRFHLEPVIEQRRHFHPEPTIEPRVVIHPAPRVEPCDQLCLTPVDPEVDPGAKRPRPSPVEPPWRVLPWETCVTPAPKVKLVIQRPDIVNKGSLIDFFI